MTVQGRNSSVHLKIPLIILHLLVYSNSSVLAMAFLALYGFVEGVARVPKKRVSAARSLLHYGVEVLQHGLHPTKRS
jgi:hypothetical protein